MYQKVKMKEQNTTHQDEIVSLKKKHYGRNNEIRKTNLNTCDRLYPFLRVFQLGTT